MFYVLSKVLLWLIQPLSLVILGLITAYLLLRRGRVRTAQRLILTCVLTLVVAGIMPLSSILLIPLEDRFARADLATGGPIDGIVVLGGGEDARVTHHRQTPTLNDAGERLTEAMSLARRFPAARIVFTGGATEILGKATHGADAAELFFREQGLDLRRLTLERQSRNTHENVVLTKALVAPLPGQRWLLVTSAFHMPRSMGCFRQAGWDVLPWPVDYRTAGPLERLELFANPVDGLRRLDFTLKEWVGLAVYRLTGRSNALFPGPAG